MYIFFIVATSTYIDRHGKISYEENQNLNDILKNDNVVFKCCIMLNARKIRKII